MHMHTKAQGKTKSKKGTKQKQEENTKNKNATKPKNPTKQKNPTGEKCIKPPGPQVSPATWPPATPSHLAPSRLLIKKGLFLQESALHPARVPF